MRSKYFLILASLFVIFCYQCKDDETSEVDPCIEKVCRSFEICDDGRCRCKDGFTGDNCATQLDPIAILITKIEVNKFPKTRITGGNWDSGSPPDLYITLFQSTTPIWTIENVLQDQDTDSICIVPTNPIRVELVNERHTISMYDDDGNRTDEFMAGVLFTPYMNTNAFPTILEVTSNPIVSYRLTLEYIHQ